MSKPKIIFFDIDGTLSDMETKKISSNTLYTLKQLQKNAIKICIATGRSPVTLPSFPGIEFDAYLTFNGSYCYDSSKVIFKNPIYSQDVNKIIHNTTKMGRPISVATQNRLAANGSDKDLEEYYALAQQELTIASDFDYVCQQEIYQIMLGCRAAEYTTILEGVTGASITAWWERGADIIPSNSGKGIGIQKILEHFHIAKEDALAFGDGNNDIEMLKAVGIGIAMENASPQLKAVATTVCSSVSCDGIYYYCLQHGLI